jgi:hypothetical protein
MAPRRIGSKQLIRSRPSEEQNVRLFRMTETAFLKNVDFSVVGGSNPCEGGDCPEGQGAPIDREDGEA